MAGCERCWAEAGRRQVERGGSKVEHYHDILAEHKEDGTECSPEEQCGELHVILDWKDGSKRCLCGKRRGE